MSDDQHEPGQSRLTNPLRPRFLELDNWDSTWEQNRAALLRRKAEQDADRNEHDEKETDK